MSDTMKDIYRTSRKAPMCSLCGRPIPVGERYRLQTIADNRTVYDWRECGFCEAVLDYVWERQDEICEGTCEECGDALDEDCVCPTCDCDVAL